MSIYFFYLIFFFAWKIANSFVEWERLDLFQLLVGATKKKGGGKRRSNAKHAANVAPKLFLNEYIVMFLLGEIENFLRGHYRFQ